MIFGVRKGCHKRDEDFRIATVYKKTRHGFLASWIQACQTQFAEGDMQEVDGETYAGPCPGPASCIWTSRCQRNSTKTTRNNPGNRRRGTCKCFPPTPAKAVFFCASVHSRD
jgi:hypothetical protein